MFWFALCQVGMATAAVRFSSAEIVLSVALDGSLLVRETLTTRAGSAHPYPYRDLPLRMMDDPGRIPAMEIDILHVAEDRRLLPWRIESSATGPRVHFGPEGQTQPAGERVYELLYHVDGQLAVEGNREMLMWLPLGPGLARPLRELRVSVAFARPMPVESLDVTFTSPTTPPERLAATRHIDADGSIHMHWRDTLAAGRRVAFLVSWPAGHLRIDTDSEFEPWLRPSRNTLWWAWVGLALSAAVLFAGRRCERPRNRAALLGVAIGISALTLYWTGNGAAADDTLFRAGFLLAAVTTLFTWFARHWPWRPGWRIGYFVTVSLLMLSAVVLLAEQVSVLYPVLWLAHVDLILLAGVPRPIEAAPRRPRREPVLNPLRAVDRLR